MEEKWLRFFNETPKRAANLKYLMKNKLTGSTLFWGLYYDWLDVINADPFLNDEEFAENLLDLTMKGYLKKVNESYQITEMGRAAWVEYQKTHPVMTNLAHFSQLDLRLWSDIFRLLVQVASEYSYHNLQYYVVTNNFSAQYLVKSWLHQHDKKTLISLIKQTLTDYLASLPAQQALVFSLFLVGHQINGKTFGQISQQTGLPVAEVKLIWLEGISCLAEQFSEPDHLFAQLVVPCRINRQFPPSAQQTYYLFQQGFSTIEISQQRHLKHNTILEHLLVAAIVCDDFEFADFFNDEAELKQLAELLPPTAITTKRFAEVQLVLPELPFFKYRLYQIKTIKEQRQLSSEVK